MTSKQMVGVERNEKFNQNISKDIEYVNKTMNKQPNGYILNPVQNNA